MDAMNLRDESHLRDRWLAERLDSVVPMVMERSGIDCWVVVGREYNEDPVLKTMLPATWITARRRTILVFTEFGRKRAAIARYDVGDVFPSAWSPSSQPNQWACLAEYLAVEDPARIALNRSETFGLADGLSSTEHAALVSALPETLGARIEPADDLAIGWLESRSSSEMEEYPDICERAHGILRRALSPEVVAPGTTTTDDVEWWLRETVRRLGYRTWFQPTVSVQRSSAEVGEGFASRPDDTVIAHGDLIHIDFGIEYLGLHTDQQQHAYVLQEHEQGAPHGLSRGLATANTLQDLVTSEFAVGVTGNEVLAAARSAARLRGIDATIYTHPIGLHGHGAGPTIGLWDQQDGVAGSGDYPIWANTAYSIELSALLAVPEWHGQRVRFMLEEDAFFDGSSVSFLDGRQEELWLI